MPQVGPISCSPGWLGAIAPALVRLSDWLWSHRMMAVSGRFTAITRVSEGSESREEDEALLAAVRQATEEEFGEDSPVGFDAP